MLGSMAPALWRTTAGRCPTAPAHIGPTALPCGLAQLADDPGGTIWVELAEARDPGGVMPAEAELLADLLAGARGDQGAARQIWSRHRHPPPRVDPSADWRRLRDLLATVICEAADPLPAPEAR